MLVRTGALAALGMLLAVASPTLSGAPAVAAPVVAANAIAPAAGTEVLIRVRDDHDRRRYDNGYRGYRSYGYDGGRYNSYGDRNWRGYRSHGYRDGYRHQRRGCRVGPNGIGCRF